MVHSEPNSTAAVPAGGHAGFFFQLHVQLGPVGMNLCHVEAADEVRDEASSVPGGAGGELTLFYQQGVGPSLVGEVVEEADTHGAASDDHALRVVAHGCLTS